MYDVLLFQEFHSVPPRPFPSVHGTPSLALHVYPFLSRLCSLLSVRLFPQLQQERIWTRVLEKVFEGDGMGEEVPGYGSELRLEDHCISAEGVSCFCF